MKRLFTVLALVTCMVVSFVSCKPDSVKLHPRVGEIFKDSNLYGDLPGDGVIFYVDKSGDSAYICSMTDVKYNANIGLPAENRSRRWLPYEGSWNSFGVDTVLEKDTIEALIRRDVQEDTVMVYPIKRKTEPYYIKEGSCKNDTVGYDEDSNLIIKIVCDTVYNHITKRDFVIWATVDSNYYYGYIGANSPDGRVNTDIILNAILPNNLSGVDSSKSTAFLCRNYYKKAYKTDIAEDNADIGYIATKGMWFLPSIEEMRHMFDAKNKINELNAGVQGFESLKDCYWTSSERDYSNAWYKCFSDNGVESYIPKSNSAFKVKLRAVRKVKL